MQWNSKNQNKALLKRERVEYKKERKKRASPPNFLIGAQFEREGATDAPLDRADFPFLASTSVLPPSHPSQLYT